MEHFVFVLNIIEPSAEHVSGCGLCDIVYFVNHILIFLNDFMRFLKLDFIVVNFFDSYFPMREEKINDGCRFSLTHTDQPVASECGRSSTEPDETLSSTVFLSLPQVLMKDIVTPVPQEEVKAVIRSCLEQAALVNYQRLSEYAKVEGKCWYTSANGGLCCVMGPQSLEYITVRNWSGNGNLPLHRRGVLYSIVKNWTGNRNVLIVGV